MIFKPRHLSVLCVLVFFAAACAPRPPVEEPAETRTRPTETRSGNEPARDEQSTGAPAVERTGEERGRRAVTVQGFRVQIENTRDKEAAERALAVFEDWQASQGGDVRNLRGEVTYRAPYYRVRVGGFRSQTEAAAMRSRLAARFPKALVAPDRVVVFE